MSPPAPQDLTDETLVGLVHASRDSDALGELLRRGRPRMKRMLLHRLDARTSGRFDSDDVLQESFIEASRRIDDFRAQLDEKGDGAMSFFLWLRLLCQQNAVKLHRQHLAAGGRDVRKEAAAPPAFADTSLVLTSALVSESTSPTAAVGKKERAVRLHGALSELAEEDRELIVLRHLEGLSNKETAQVMGLTESNTSRRNVRLLLRLREIARAQKIELTGFAS